MPDTNVVAIAIGTVWFLMVVERSCVVQHNKKRLPPHLPAGRGYGAVVGSSSSAQEGAHLERSVQNPNELEPIAFPNK